MRLSTFLLSIIIAMALWINLFNKPKTNTEIKTIIAKEYIHDTVYKYKVDSVKESFKSYIKHRDSVLIDTTKIDSVLATKIDTVNDIRISAIVLADSLTTCKELLNMANIEVLHKDTVIAKIDSTNKKGSPINWQPYSIVGASALVIGILLGIF